MVCIHTLAESKGKPTSVPERPAAYPASKLLRTEVPLQVDTADDTDDDDGDTDSNVPARRRPVVGVVVVAERLGTNRIDDFPIARLVKHDVLVVDDDSSMVRIRHSFQKWQDGYWYVLLLLLLWLLF